MPQLRSDTSPSGGYRFYGFAIILALILWLLASATWAQKKIEVDLALVLAVDCSVSVDSTEFNQQMQGLAQAFASKEVIDAVVQGPLGRIAIMVVEWSGPQDQKIVIPWTVVNNAVSARQVAGAISLAPRATTGITSISGAINFGISQLTHSPFIAHRQVIDISADGFNNSGGPTMLPRDRALAAGITINGLTVHSDVSVLDAYFITSVISGPGSFVMVANDYKAYGTAIKRKLLREIVLILS